jgi:hypothetical protein
VVEEVVDGRELLERVLPAAVEHEAVTQQPPVLALGLTRAAAAAAAAAR